jgi:hypothetical protein
MTGAPAVKPCGAGPRTTTARRIAVARRPAVSDGPGSSFDLSLGRLPLDEPRPSPGAPPRLFHSTPQFFSTVTRLVRKDSHV